MAISIYNRLSACLPFQFQEWRHEKNSFSGLHLKLDQNQSISNNALITSCKVVALLPKQIAISGQPRVVSYHMLSEQHG